MSLLVSLEQKPSPCPLHSLSFRVTGEMAICPACWALPPPSGTSWLVAPWKAWGWVSRKIPKEHPSKMEKCGEGENVFFLLQIPGKLGGWGHGREECLELASRPPGEISAEPL